MKAGVMISMIPIGGGLSLSPYIAACERILQEEGLGPELHAHGTNIEGEWDQAFAAIKRCVETVHSMGAPRVSLYLKVSTRTDRELDGDAMVRSVRDKLTGG